MSELTREKLEEMRDFAIEAFKKNSSKQGAFNITIALNATVAAIKADEALGRKPSQPGSGWC